MRQRRKAHTAHPCAPPRACAAAFKEGRWDELAELIYSVRGSDACRPSNTSAPLGEQGPTLRKQDRLLVRAATDAPTRGRSNSTRGRSGSTEGPRSAEGTPQPPQAPQLLHAASVASMVPPSRMGRMSMMGGDLLSVSASLAAMEDKMAARDDADAQFKLPPEVNAELALMQAELDNHMTINELTAALSSGGPVGPIGDMEVDPVDVRARRPALTRPALPCTPAPPPRPALQISQLSIALKRAARCGYHTPRAASLVYTASIVRDLRAYLRPLPVSRAAGAQGGGGTFIRLPPHRSGAAADPARPLARGLAWLGPVAPADARARRARAAAARARRLGRRRGDPARRRAQQRARRRLRDARPLRQRRALRAHPHGLARHRRGARLHGGCGSAARVLRDPGARGRG